MKSYSIVVLMLASLAACGGGGGGDSSTSGGAAAASPQTAVSASPAPAGAPAGAGATTDPANSATPAPATAPPATSPATPGDPGTAVPGTAPPPSAAPTAPTSPTPPAAPPASSAPTAAPPVPTVASLLAKMVDGVQDNQVYRMRFSLVGNSNNFSSFVDRHPLQIFGRLLPDSRRQISFNYDLPAGNTELVTLNFGDKGSSLALSLGGFLPVASNGIALLNGPSTCAPTPIDLSRLNVPASVAGVYSLGSLFCESTWNSPSTSFTYDASIVRKTDTTCIRLTSLFDRAPGYEYCWADELNNASLAEQSGPFASQWTTSGPAAAPGSQSLVRMLDGIQEGVSFRLRYKEERDASFFAAGPTELLVVGKRWPNGDVGMEFRDPNDSSKVTWSYQTRAGLTGLTSFLAFDGMATWPTLTELGPVPFDPIWQGATNGPVINNPTLGNRLVSFASLTTLDTSSCLGFTRGLPTTNTGFTFCWSNDLQRTLVRQFGGNASTTYYTDQATARNGL